RLAERLPRGGGGRAPGEQGRPARRGRHGGDAGRGRPAAARPSAGPCRPRHLGGARPARDRAHARAARRRRPGRGAGDGGRVSLPGSRGTPPGGRAPQPVRPRRGSPAGRGQGAGRRLMGPGVGFLDLPPRAEKPRSIGLTHVLDKGTPLTVLESHLSSIAPYCDVWKFGWGTAYIDPAARAKVELLRRQDVLTCPGGTLLEIAFL